MAFVVEDGTGLPNANSYASPEMADAYFADRMVTTWSGNNEQKQGALVRATDYIDTRFNFKGCPITDTQALKFPRDDSGALPVNLLKATYEYALRTLQNKPLLPDPVTDDSGNRVKSTSKELGPLKKKIEYMESSSTSLIKAYPAADLLLKSLLRNTGGGTYR